MPEVETSGAPGDGLARHSLRRIETQDAGSMSGESAALDVAPLRTRVVLESERTEAYACIPLAHVVECRTDKQVVLNDKFMPTVLRSRASARLAAFTAQLVGKLHQRGEALSVRASATGASATAQLQDYLTLQAINRYEPLLIHFNETGAQHPESLYQVFVAMAGELATYTRKARRPPALAPYQHDRLRESFEPVMALLDDELSTVIDPSAIRIPIEPRRHGIFVATVADRTLFSSSVFVLAAAADVPAEDFRRRFPAQLKLGPVEKIRDLVMLALTGVPVTHLPAVPRQIPFHKGYAYFELDQSHELWSQLPSSGGVALHAGEFPGLKMEFWAIRAER
jgi:type VI secretion system protein ImpJ